MKKKEKSGNVFTASCAESVERGVCSVNVDWNDGILCRHAGDHTEAERRTRVRTAASTDLQVILQHPPRIDKLLLVNSWFCRMGC